MASGTLLRTSMCAAIWMLAASGPALAQSAISGIVRDASGAVLPGVTVTASSPALIERSRTAVCDGAGAYRIVDLFNAFNARPPLALNTRYGTSWLTPTSTLIGRLVKFAAKVEF